jgi:hypothetical protein
VCAVAEIKSTEAGLEQGDSAADSIRKMLDRFQERLTLSNPRLIERYRKSELHILIEIKMLGTDRQYVACFQGINTGLGGSDHDLVRGSKHGVEHLLGQLSFQVGHVVPHRGAEVQVIEPASSNCDQQPMLIDIVKAIEGPQLMPLPSLVWLGSAESIYSILPQGLYYSGKIGFVSRGRIVNGEIEIGIRVSVGDHKKQLVGQVIERTSEILDCVSGDGGDIGGYGVSSANGGTLDLAGMHITIGDEFVWVGAPESFKRRLKIEEVLFGPFNFDLNPRKFFIGSHIKSQ